MDSLDFRQGLAMCWVSTTWRQTWAILHAKILGQTLVLITESANIGNNAALPVSHSHIEVEFRIEV